MTIERIETPLQRASRVLIPAVCIAIAALLAVAGPQGPVQASAAASAQAGDHECLSPSHHAAVADSIVNR